MRHIINSLVVVSSLLSSQVVKDNTSSLGVEVNIIRTLYLKQYDIDSISGSFNYFNDTKAYEIAIPFTYNKFIYSDSYFRPEDCDDIGFNLGVHMRKFIKDKKANGLYVGGFGRYTYLEGREKGSVNILNLNRFGVGLELGFRDRKKDSNFYYGFSIQGGMYIDNNNGDFAHNIYLLEMDNKKYFWDIEFLKIGYEF